jgi:NhaP-type Na+/H+ or K+/H+ antiporter
MRIRSAVKFSTLGGALFGSAGRSVWVLINLALYGVPKGHGDPFSWASFAIMQSAVNGAVIGFGLGVVCAIYLQWMEAKLIENRLELLRQEQANPPSARVG